MSDKVTISASEYKKMQRELAKLNALEAGGVDKWEWFEDSLKEWFERNKKDELICGFIEDLNDVMAEAYVEQPAGPGCGYAITFNEDFVEKLLLKFIDDIKGDEK